MFSFIVMCRVMHPVNISGTFLVLPNGAVVPCVPRQSPMSLVSRGSRHGRLWERTNSIGKLIGRSYARDVGETDAGQD
jgi:hypothetical protein